MAWLTWVGAIMYLDAPVYIWGVQCIYMAYLTGGEACVGEALTMHEIVRVLKLV
jgi:hypothetical protein